MDLPARFVFEEAVAQDDVWTATGFPLYGSKNLDSSMDSNACFFTPIRPKSHRQEDACYNESLENDRQLFEPTHSRKRKYMSTVVDKPMKTICHADLRQNHIWTPALELDTLKNYHFGTVLPRLSSLVPQYSPGSCLRFPNMSAIDNDYSKTYLRLLVVAMSNNLAGVKDLPAASIFAYIETRFTTKQIGVYLTSLTKAASRAFSEGLLRCAVSARNAGVIDFILSRKDCTIGADTIVPHPCSDRQTLWQHTVDIRNIPIARVLIKHGADVNTMLEYAAVRRVSRFTRRDLDFISLLFDSGAHASADMIIAILDNTFWQDSDVRMCQRLLFGSTPGNWERWERNEILFTAMTYLSNEYCLEFAEFMIESGVQLNVEHHDAPFREDRYGMKGSPARFIIDASASRGDQQLVQKFLEKGASLTKYTLEHAVWSGNIDLVEYLIDEADVLEKQEPSDGLLELISLTNRIEMISLLESYGVFPEACRERLCILEIRNELHMGQADAMKTLLRRLNQHRRDLREKPFERERRIAEALTSFLVEAINLGREDMARVLIDGGASFEPGFGIDSDDEDDIDSWPPLLAAVEAKNVNIIKALLDAGADPNSGGGLARSPLSLAIEWGEVSVVDALILAGADVNALSIVEYRRGRVECSPLALAVQRKNMELARRLLEVGADPDGGLQQIRAVLTPLEASVKNRDQAMMELLFTSGCDPAHSFALETAVEDDSIEIVQILLRHFAQRYPYGKARYGTKALRNAIHRARIDLVYLLVEGKVDIRYCVASDKCSDFAESPLSIAIKTDRSAGQEILRLFLRSGIGPNDAIARFQNPSFSEDAENPPRYTPLLEAIWADNHSAISALIECGADIEWEPKMGVRRTPLQYASEMGNKGIVELLLEEGACVNELPASRGGATALQLAAIGGYVGIAELLLTHGAEVNGPTANVRGRSAIDGAAEHGRFHMVEYLLGCGAVLELDAGYDDCRAIRLAKEHGHMAVVQLIREHLDGGRVVENPNRANSMLLPSSSDQRPLCGACKISFKNKSSLARHMRTKHTSPSCNSELEHKCPICPTTFKRKDMLTRHLSTHTNAMRTSCVTCKKEFSRKDYLKAQHLDEMGRCKALISAC